MKISDVRATTFDVPLAHPIVMGELRYDTREYVVVEIRTDEGLTGIGLGMTRDAPVAAIVRRNLAPLLIDRDPLLGEQLWERMYYANLPMGQRGIFMRALSAVDIALWDIKGKAAGLPVWKLLGGFRQRVPALVAGGYANADTTLDDLRGEIASYLTQGFRSIKISAGDIAQDTARLEVARAAAGAGVSLAYDVHWAWRRLHEVLPIVRGWEAFNLAWIEDPFPSEFTDLAATLRREVRIPLALGEDAVGRWSYREMFRRGFVDIVRLDATTVGGLSEAARVCTMAAAEGLPVSPHIFPEVHIHLGAAFPCVASIEVTDPSLEIDMMHKLLVEGLTVRDGEAIAPEAPGLGIEIDWSGAAAYEKAGA